jgi:hypothetical protein
MRHAGDGDDATVSEYHNVLYDTYSVWRQGRVEVVTSSTKWRSSVNIIWRTL